MKDVAKQYEVEKYIRLEHSVEGAVWREDTGKWEITVRNGDRTFTDVCDVFINASGVLKYVVPSHPTSCMTLIEAPQQLEVALHRRLRHLQGKAHPLRPLGPRLRLHRQTGRLYRNRLLRNPNHA